mmetsp:Transcript_609/g.1024  ORF Transcript_609/g.1024 Transcript_609/m.1024 type:complete len:159 (-) Transcript_609:818-1294(-)
MISGPTNTKNSPETRLLSQIFHIVLICTSTQISGPVQKVSIHSTQNTPSLTILSFLPMMKSPRCIGLTHYLHEHKSTHGHSVQHSQENIEPQNQLHRLGKKGIFRSRSPVDIIIIAFKTCNNHLWKEEWCRHHFFFIGRDDGIVGMRSTRRRYFRVSW